MKTPVFALIFSAAFFLTNFCPAYAQTITGAWKGKLGAMKTELKLIKKGDSLFGTSYYYLTKNNYRRYSVKGYFDSKTNSVIWWDDVLLEEKGGGSIIGTSKEPFLSIADFNCPGEDKMLLEGKTTDRDDKDKETGSANMQKVSTSMFSDEWDYVLDNYFVGANQPDIIDSIAGIAFAAPVIPKGFEAPVTAAVVKVPPAPPNKPAVTEPTTKSAGVAKAPPADARPDVVQTIEQKFANRSNKLQTVIPIAGEKIELRFYDNAQVDGDSIALFLNGRMMFTHIRLTEQAYTVFIDTKDLSDDNELVMVAENLGSIPPNTSFMVAIVGDKRYEARLYANENSSALIRFVRN